MSPVRPPGEPGRHEEAVAKTGEAAIGRPWSRVQACRFSANCCPSLMAGTTRGRPACNGGGQPTPGSHEGPGPRLSARASRGNCPRVS
jgi:hypothetical protein